MVRVCGRQIRPARKALHSWANALWLILSDFIKNIQYKLIFKCADRVFVNSINKGRAMKAQGTFSGSNSLLKSVMNSGAGLDSESPAMRALHGRRGAAGMRNSNEAQAKLEALQQQAAQGKGDMEAQVAESLRKKAEQKKLEEKQAEERRAAQAQESRQVEGGQNAASGGEAAAPQGDVVRISMAGAQAAQSVHVARMPEPAPAPAPAGESADSGEAPAATGVGALRTAEAPAPEVDTQV